jgi:nucleoside 2-deoxyribosyltransferase
VNVYFSCSITGGRTDQREYAEIVRALLEDGHEVPTAHLSDADILQVESRTDPFDIYQRDISWIHACDAVVAEVSTPSHGVGYEIAYALNLSKPVLCGFRQGRRVTKMILGNNSPTLHVVEYLSVADFVREMRSFLRKTREGSGR